MNQLPRPSRRALLGGATAVVAAGAAGALGVDEGWLPGRVTAYRVLGLDGPNGTVPANRPGRILSGSFVSRFRLGRTTGWSLAFPPGHTTGRLPVVVALHGLGGTHLSAFGQLGFQHFLAQAVAQGVPPFAIASVDGGTTYWHRRPSGEDAGAMVLEELLPVLGRHGVGVSRVGFLGWSMGGYGALRLAGLLGPSRCGAVAAMSPALWVDPADASVSGFSSPQEYERYSVLGRQHDLDGIAVRIDCGTGDPFYEATQQYRAGFTRAPAGGFEAGGHTPGYWRRMAPDEVRFLGSHLASGTTAG